MKIVLNHCESKANDYKSLSKICTKLIFFLDIEEHKD